MYLTKLNIPANYSHLSLSYTSIVIWRTQCIPKLTDGELHVDLDDIALLYTQCIPLLATNFWFLEWQIICQHGLALAPYFDNHKNPSGPMGRKIEEAAWFLQKLGNSFNAEWGDLILRSVGLEQPFTQKTASELLTFIVLTFGKHARSMIQNTATSYLKKAISGLHRKNLLLSVWAQFNALYYFNIDNLLTLSNSDDEETSMQELLTKQKILKSVPHLSMSECESLIADLECCTTLRSENELLQFLDKQL